MASKTVKIAAGIAVIIVVGVAAAFYLNYRAKIKDMNEKLVGVIDKDQGSMEITLKIPGSETSYDETFSLCDKCLNDRIQLIINLRGIHPDMKSELKDSLMDFLSLENELVRDLKLMYWHLMDLTGKFQTIKRLENTGFSYLYKSELQSDIDEAKDEGKEALACLNSFKDKYASLIGRETSIAKQTEKENLRFAQILGKYQAANIGLADKLIKSYHDLEDYGNDTK